MASIRQNKVSELLKRELSTYFQQNARTVCKGAMTTVTIVRVSRDLAVAKVYLSLFGVPDIKEAYEEIKSNSASIRMEMAKIMRNQLRKIPEFQFYIDDSLDYAETIDNLLKS